MKTIFDLMMLILDEITMNENKLVTYTFSIDTHYQWCSMFQNIPDAKNLEVINHIPLFSCMKFSTPEELQLVYWSIYNLGRKSKNIK